MSAGESSLVFLRKPEHFDLEEVRTSSAMHQFMTIMSWLGSGFGE